MLCNTTFLIVFHISSPFSALFWNWSSEIQDGRQVRENIIMVIEPTNDLLFEMYCAPLGPLQWISDGYQFDILRFLSHLRNSRELSSYKNHLTHTFIYTLITHNLPHNHTPTHPAHLIHPSHQFTHTKYLKACLGTVAYLRKQMWWTIMSTEITFK